MVITVRIQNTVFCLYFVVRFALDNIFVRVLTLYGVSHYDAANVLVTASRPRLGKRLRRVCTASYSENPVVYLWIGLGRPC